MTALVWRVVELEPGAFLDHGEEFWQDAIVFVAAGELDVDCAAGGHHRFRVGDILTFAGLSLRGARNTGVAPAHLLAVWRRPLARQPHR